MSLDKQLILFDKSESKDESTITHTHQKTAIEIRDEDTGELIFKGSNKVIIPGSTFTAVRHFNLPGHIEVTPSYNTALQLDNNVSDNPEGLDVSKCFLFAVGTDGCGLEPSQVYNVDYTKWIMPENLVPFRYVPISLDIDVSLRDSYFGRKTGSEYIAYYFKAFETAPVYRQQYLDGTPIDGNIYTSLKTDEVESFVELRLKVTKEDCRDYFTATTGDNDAKVNTISLLTAWPRIINGHTYYQDIRPLTKLNFPNETLIDKTKGLDITYHIYY